MLCCGASPDRKDKDGSGNISKTEFPEVVREARVCNLDLPWRVVLLPSAIQTRSEIRGLGANSDHGFQRQAW